MIAINQFQVVERLAQGGTGSVYLATRSSSEQYALKVLRRENLGNEESQASLRREAELLTVLQHPNVVRLLEVGSDCGEPFLVMEFIDGLSLSELLSYPLRMPLAVGVTIVRDALRALSYIHDVEREGGPRGIIHGDGSPQNLLVGSDGRARLIDFGVAREPGMPARDSVVRCKPRYASPELLAGDPLGSESDLFAVGAVLFHVLTGRKLFNATDQAELIGQVTRAEIPPPSSVSSGTPRAFDDLSLRALQRDRKRRYQRAGEMLDAIERAADSAGIVLSSTLVSDWVVRVQRSLSEDVELAPSEVQALLKPGDAKDHASDSNRLATAPPSGRLGLLSRLSPPVRFAIGVVAVVVALGVILFAILAPEAFVRMLSE
jgi:serine/threonine-protein kinase